MASLHGGVKLPEQLRISNLDSVGYGPDNRALPEGTFPPRG